MGGHLESHEIGATQSLGDAMKIGQTKIGEITISEMRSPK
jgi:hypothetical protein